MATVSVPGVSLWLGLGVSGPLSIAIAKAVSTIAKAKTVAVKTTVSVPRISLWLGLSISVTLAQTVSKGSNTIDAKGDSGGRNNRGSRVAEAVSSVQTTKAVTVSQPWLSLGFGLGVALPQVSRQGKAVASVGSVMEGLGGQVVGSSGLDCE